MEEQQTNSARSDSDHYREMASKLRKLARQFRFSDARRALLDLVSRYEQRGDSLHKRRWLRPRSSRLGLLQIASRVPISRACHRQGTGRTSHPRATASPAAPSNPAPSRTRQKQCTGGLSAIIASPHRAASRARPQRSLPMLASACERASASCPVRPAGTGSIFPDVP
jgi:hypothetical protein